MKAAPPARWPGSQVLARNSPSSLKRVMTRTSSSAVAPLAVQDDPQHLSFSQLTMLHGHYRYACPRKWGYRYKLGLAEMRSPSLALGSAMDEAANCFFSMCLE